MNSEQKIDEIHKMVSKQGVELAKIVVRNEQYRKELDDHKEKIDEHEKYKNKAVGAGLTLGGFFGFIGALIGKHL